jgi:hypothetical protein
VQPGKIDPTRLRPAKSAKQADDEATCLVLAGIGAGVLLLGCCLGGTIVGTVWAVIG